MNGTKSLIESKQFWGMFLSLAAFICKTFGLSQYVSLLADPALVDKMVTLGGFFGIFLGMIGRFTATQQITSVLPKGSAANAPKALLYLALLPLLGLGGCANLTAEQRTNLSLQLALAKQIGHDAVSIWCATSGVVYIVAKNVNAQSRVTDALAINSQVATDACPMIGQITGVQVVLPTTLPMSVTKGT